jgi:biotin transport system substrate-specific component
MFTTYVERYRVARYNVFKWRYELSIVKKIGLALGMAVLTGLVAQIRILLPWSPVPITGQTFAVLLAGVLLGRWYGGLSQLIYAVLGFAGVPWFGGWSAGIGVLLGPTGGYIIGFVLAAWFIGYFTDTRIRSRNFFPMLGLMLFANFVLIHGPGLMQLGLYLSIVKGLELTLVKLLWLGTIPFIPGDILKAVAAAAAAKSITPKESYNGEVDAENLSRAESRERIRIP